ncbi:ester cyclase [Leptospira sp. 'Mane']|uniref:nuclear transport factor 2 family protein n=1 Tax=Leptospira sp. 'Mane' TaxID=3387407 RepID=UPI00398AB3E2
MKLSIKSIKHHMIHIGTATLLIFCFLSCSQKEDKQEKNKQIVGDFYNLIFKDHKPKEAVERYVGDKYIQHNPYVPDGTEAFLGFFIPFFKENPDSIAEIKRIVAEGDLVFLHVHAKQNKQDRGQAIIDIFRVENGKIVEHWDVVQPIPEKSANTNTMF